MANPANFTQTVSCAICLHTFPDDLNQCAGCGEYHCDECPAFACSCTYEDEPEFEQACRRLRAHAMELASLRAQSEMMGSDSLTSEQQARLGLLIDVVRSLRREVNRMDEVRCGEVYPDDEPMPD